MPKHSETDTHSAGYPRQSGGSDVDGSVHVTIMDGATIRARPFTIGERQLVPSRSAFATCFRGRKEAIDLDQPSFVPRRLIGQHQDQFTPARIGDGSAATLGAQHPLHRHGFDGDRLVLADQPSAEFVQEVLPCMAHGSMGAGHFQLGLRPVLSSLLLLRQTTLQARKPLLALGQMARVVRGAGEP